MMRKFFRSKAKNNAVFDDEKNDYLNSTPPEKWSVDDVCAYLEINSLGEFRRSFRSQQISGRDMLELSESDLKILGMNEVQRNRFLRKIKLLKVEEEAEEQPRTIVAETSVLEESVTRVKVKCKYKDRAKLMLLDYLDFAQLTAEIAKRWKLRSFVVRFVDTDGDLVDVTSDEDLQQIAQTADGMLRFVVHEKKRFNHIKQSERELLQAWTEPVFIYSHEGTRLFQNSAANEYPLLTLDDLLPELQLTTYLNTMESKFVGRKSQMEVFNGKTKATLEVTIAETWTENRHTFTVTLHKSLVLHKGALQNVNENLKEFRKTRTMNMPVSGASKAVAIALAGVAAPGMRRAKK